MEEKLYATACAKSLGVSPVKVRLLIDLVRGKKVGEAVAILSGCKSPFKTDVIKVINSAVANAVNNDGLDANALYIKEIYCNGGTMLKRMHPRAKGSGNRILKRTSHLTCTVAVKEA